MIPLYGSHPIILKESNYCTLLELLDRRNPDPLLLLQKRQLQPADLKSGYLSRNLPKKQTQKEKKKERNFQPLQSDHYGLLEVNQPVPLPRSLFDGFPHGISTIFVHQIFIPKKAKKANGCIPFVGISFFGFVKSQKRKKQQRQFSPPESFHHHPHHLLHFHLQHWLAIHPAG